MSDKEVLSAYIHIPFCKSKCKYCSFVSGTDFGKKTGYLYSLLKEIDFYYKNEKLKTLYIGGGTPSVLTLDELSKIIKKFSFNSDYELTVEINPNDINQDFMKGLKDLGVNRISTGAQSFDDNILKLIGRRHSSAEIYKAVDIARKIGFENISLDLIYGLPTQTIQGFEHDIKEIIKLDVEHLSLYGLKIDEGCYFYDNPPEAVADEDIQADMYLMAGELTSAEGYEHYEVSNYAKKGYSSKHNTNYWRCGQYYGFGLSAHGYTDGVRYSNTCNITEYLNNPTVHEYGKFLTEQEMLEEKIFLGLRLAEGINVADINTEFNIDFNKKYQSVLDKYKSPGYIIDTPTGYAFSDKKETNGFLLSNPILSDFIDV